MAPEHRVPRLILGCVEVFLAIEPADGRGIKERLRPCHRRQPGRLRIPLIPADERAHGQPAGRNRAETGVARGEEKLLVVVWVIRDVHLAVGARQPPVGLEHDRRVVKEPVGPSLKHTPHEHHTMLPGSDGELLRQRPRHALGLLEAGMVFRLAGILPGEEFLQADKLRTSCRCLGDSRQGLPHVGIAVGRAGCLDKAHSDHTALASLGRQRSSGVHCSTASRPASSLAAGTGN